MLERIFDFDDQEIFASATGDRNPMHMNPQFARRTQAGHAVVHGMHVVLWAVDVLAEKYDLKDLGSIRYRFSRFIAVGATVNLDDASVDDGYGKISITTNDVLAITITLARAQLGTASDFSDTESEVVVGLLPYDMDAKAIEASSGALLPPPGAAGQLAETYAFATKLLGMGGVASLGLTSTLVGMVSPGLHSIYSEGMLDLQREDAIGRLAFTTRQFDERFQMATIDVASPGVRGSIVAYLRSPPIEAPNLASVALRVSSDAFSGRKALVVGGSRGLGAAATTLLAAGGADVTTTFRTGRQEAETLVAQLDSVAIQPQIMRLDVGMPINSLADHNFTHLYFFATPKIFRQGSTIFDQALFAEFLKVYVSGFADVIVACRRENTPLHALYPSSVAVTKRPRGMTEYAMAKSAGEIMCEDLVKATKGLTIDIPRLPRILTDQTATVPPVPAENPVDVLLPLLFGN